jgi:hypothetical protein
MEEACEDTVRTSPGKRILVDGTTSYATKRHQPLLAEAQTDSIVPIAPRPTFPLKRQGSVMPRLDQLSLQDSSAFPHPAPDQTKVHNAAATRLYLTQMECSQGLDFISLSPPSLPSEALQSHLHKTSSQLTFYFPRPHPFSNPWAAIPSVARYVGADDGERLYGLLGEEGPDNTQCGLLPQQTASGKPNTSHDNAKDTFTSNYDTTSGLITANHVRFPEACAEFGIHPCHRIYHGIKLTPWQIVDMSWCAKMLHSDVRFAINGGDPGTGKRVTTLSTLLGRALNTQLLINTGTITQLSAKAKRYPREMIAEILATMPPIPDYTSRFSQNVSISTSAEVRGDTLTPVESKLDLPRAYTRLTSPIFNVFDDLSGQVSPSPEIPDEHQDETIPAWVPTLSTSLGEGPYFPTLVIVPPAGPVVWAEELRIRFPAITYYFFGHISASPASANTDCRVQILPTLNDLHDLFLGFDYTNPLTTLHVIITTCLTWRKRTLSGPSEQSNTGEANNRLASRFKGRWGTVVVDEGYQNTNAAFQAAAAIAENPKQNLVILSSTTSFSQPTDLEGKLHLLQQVCTWSGSGDCDELGAAPGAASPLQTYMQTTTRLGAHMESDPTNINWLDLKAVLSPRYYRDAIRAASAYAVSPAIGSVMRPILLLLQTRVTKGSTIQTFTDNPPGHVGTVLQPYRVVTIELQFSKSSQDLYDEAFYSIITDGQDTALSSNGHATSSLQHQQHDNSRISRNVSTRRWLGHIGVNPLLGRLRDLSTLDSVNPLAHGISTERLRRLQQIRNETRPRDGGPQPQGPKVDIFTGSHNISEWCNEPDYGLSRLFNTVSLYHENSLPFDRVAISRWLTQHCPRLQYIAGLILEICIRKLKKMTVVWMLPMSQWYCELWLTVLEIPFLRLNSKMSTRQRAEVNAAFADPSDPRKILVGNYSSLHSSTNIHRSCHHVVFAELGAAVGDQMHILGRLVRLGQTEEVEVYILTINHTFDQFVQAVHTQKYLPALATSLNLDVDAIMQLHKYREEQGKAGRLPKYPDCSLDDITSQGFHTRGTPFELVTNDALLQESTGDTPQHTELLLRARSQAQKLQFAYTALLGQRSFRGRPEWLAWTKPDAKDRITEEKWYLDKVRQCYYHPQHRPNDPHETGK